MLGVALVILVFFRDVVFLGDSFFERDLQILWYGHAASFRHQWAAGSWPFWDPSQSFGQPFLANPNTSTLYPWTWLGLVLAPETQYTVFAVGHVVLTAVGMLLLGRRLGLSAVPASVAAPRLGPVRAVPVASDPVASPGRRRLDPVGHARRPSGSWSVPTDATSRPWPRRRRFRCCRDRRTWSS